VPQRVEALEGEFRATAEAEARHKRDSSAEIQRISEKVRRAVECLTLTVGILSRPRSLCARRRR